MKMRYRNISIWGGLLVALFSSCVEDARVKEDDGVFDCVSFNVSKVEDVVGKVDNKTRNIRVSVHALESDVAEEKSLYVHRVSENGMRKSKLAANGKDVRGGYMTTESLKNMAVSGYVWDKGSEDRDMVSPNLMEGEKVSRSNGWETSVPRPAVNKSSMFLAYSPYDCKGVHEVVNSNGALYFSYTVPKKNEEQQDLLVSKTGVLENLHDSEEKVSLSFDHALAGIRLKISKNAMHKATINKVVLENVYGKAKYALHGVAERGQSLGEWSGWSEPTTFVLAPEGGIKTDGKRGDFLVGGPIGERNANYTFMMIPQQLPEEAKMIVVYTDNLGLEHVLTAPIGRMQNSTWQQNCTETYEISDRSISYVPHFEFLVKDKDGQWKELSNEYLASHEGEEVDYQVKSFVEVSQSGKPTQYKPVPWNMSFEEGENPLWLEGLNTSGKGSGGKEGELGKFVVAPQVAQTKSTHDEVLKEATPVSGLYNLSHPTGETLIENTANTYVINRAGTYWFPLAFGNAVKDGKVNSSAYTSSNSGKMILSKFVDCYDYAISTWSIVEQMKKYGNHETYLPHYALKAWEDCEESECMVKDVQLTYSKGEPHGVQFSVDQSKIHQGNAVIAVKNRRGDVVWSWQIWVTDYQLGTDLKHHKNRAGSYDFMPINLGWCFSDGEYYAPRDTKALFKQDLSGVDDNLQGEELELTLRQSEHYEDVGGNASYYQFGRKDPQVAGIVVNTQKRYTSEDGYNNVSAVPAQTTIGGAIRNFNWFYHYSINSHNNFKSDYNANTSWCSTKDFYINLWDMNASRDFRGQSKVVKTIYDPSPVGYSVAPYRSFEELEFSDNVYYGVTVTTKAGIGGKGDKLFFPYCGARYGDTGVYNYVWRKTGEMTGFVWTGGLNVSNRLSSFRMGVPFKTTKDKVELMSSYSLDSTNGLCVRCVKEQ